VLTAGELGGFSAAHAIWSVSDGSTLIPMLTCVDQNNERQMIRLVQDQLEKAVQDGKARLEANPMDANDAALLYDGYITHDGAQVDAVIIELRSYFSPGSRVAIAVPYTPGSGASFKVHKPKLLQWSACEDFDVEAVFKAFFTGIGQHEQGARIWADSLDESR